MTETFVRPTKTGNEQIRLLCIPMKKLPLCLFHNSVGKIYAIMHNVRRAESKVLRSWHRRHDGLRVGYFMEVFMMVRQVKVSNFAEVQGIVSAAAKCYNEVGVHDMKGSIADAKSILGMMSLDYSHPVKIVCEDEHDLDCVMSALRQ